MSWPRVSPASLPNDSFSFPFPENPQKEQLSTKGRPFRGMSEEEVFTEVANLFRGQEDLLSEFGQFLPEAKRSLVSTEHPPPSGATFSARAPHLSAAFRPGRAYPLPQSHAQCSHPWAPRAGSTPSLTWSRSSTGLLWIESGGCEGRFGGQSVF